MKSNGKRKRMIALAAALYVLPLVLLAAALLPRAASAPYRSFFGYRFFSMRTGSMKPTLQAGDLLIVEAEPRTMLLQAGDVITFNEAAYDSDNNAVNTSRVIQVVRQLRGVPGLYFRTKGDANRSADPPIMAQQVIGRQVGRVPLLGYVLNVLRTRAAAAVFCLLALLICWKAAGKIRRRVKLHADRSGSI